MGLLLALCLNAFLAASSLTAAATATPEWIWHDGQGAKIGADETAYFRKLFNVAGRPVSATLTITCDNEMELYLNGKSAGTVTDWKKPAVVDAAKFLQAGNNAIAVRGKNKGGSTAGLVARLEIKLADGQLQTVVTDVSWKTTLQRQDNWETLNFAPGGWTPALALGKLGISPWGDALKIEKKVATPAEALKLLPGFKAELVRSAEPGEGSWVCMTIDAWGRMIVSPQETVSTNEGGMLRFTLDPEGRLRRLEKLNVPVGGAQGLLYAFDSLYVMGKGPDGTGLYRLRDMNFDDQFDEIKLLQKFTGRGEHGSHGLLLGPDKKIYMMNGNFVRQIEGLSPESPFRNFAEDLLLPRQPDGNGFGNGTPPPGGHVLRTDAEGKTWELVSAGFRNAYDFAFNPDGELFTYDSDMEWDIGSPWYRPTRLLHVVPGGDYGFREGTGKWPNWYPDSLPTLADIGVGSPTGVKFGTRAKFPVKYKRALYALDWAYGKIYAAHLTADGAGYKATVETFISGKPLNVTDVEIGGEGAMYFITGGRGTQSGLYRVTYDEEYAPEPPKTKAEIKAEAHAAGSRLVRRTLENYAGRKDPKAVEIAWPHLDSPDRNLRYAARVALESQDLALWKAKALKEGKTRASLSAMLALARTGTAEDLAPLLRNLQRHSYKGLGEDLKLELLRVYQVAFVRLGKPTAAQAKELLARLQPHYPATTEPQNRELCQLMVYLNAPDVVSKTMKLLGSTTNRLEEMYYVFTLRHVTNTWTLKEREGYFQWLDMATHDYKGGNSYKKFLANIRKEAIATLNPAEREGLTAWLVEEAITTTNAVARAFVKEWKVAELASVLDDAGKGRSFAKGRKAFTDLQCHLCHRFGNDGGSIGPDITAAASRFNRRDLLETIIEPSKIVSDQYQNHVVVKRDGTEYTGRIAEEDDAKLTLVYNPLAPQRVVILKKDVEKKTVSTVSPMPDGLINTLTKEEILDLLAYIESGGQEKSAAFAK